MSYEYEERKLTHEELEMEADEAMDIEYRAHLKGLSVEDYMNLMTKEYNERNTVMEDDYEVGDEFDWDRNDSSQYCKHGRFIGSWWGPDILCGACEAGDEPMIIDDTDDF
jgi:hypothetical protein